jgi:hypothetical protein
MHTYVALRACSHTLIVLRSLFSAQQYRCHMTHEASMEYLKAMVYFVGGVLARTPQKHARMMRTHTWMLLCALTWHADVAM